MDASRAPSVVGSNALRRYRETRRISLSRRVQAASLTQTGSGLGPTDSVANVLVRLVLMIGVAAGLAAGGVPAATAAGATPSKCIADYNDDARPGFFPQLRTLGVRTWSSGINWASIAPTRPADPSDPSDPAYQWPAGFDRTLDRAVANGIEPVLLVNGFPGWSNGGQDTLHVSDPGSYATFMAAAVKRYPQVRRWQVFGEPSNPVNYLPQGRAGVRAYARLLDASYVAMHAARRNVVVIGANLHPSGNDGPFGTSVPTWIRLMRLPNGRPPRMDLFGINPYSERAPRLADPKRPGVVDLNDLDYLTKVLDRTYRGRRLKLFIGEFGWNTEHAAAGSLYVKRRADVARDLPKAFAVARQSGRVDTMCWYQLYDDAPAFSGSQRAEWTSGLRLTGGRAKPALKAFKRVPSGPSRVAR